MKKRKTSSSRADPDRDSLREGYDFSAGVRGVTAVRYRQGANTIALDPAVMDVFPDSEAVNETLRALAPILRRQRRTQSKPKKR